MSLTPRQRVLSALSHEEPDRVPLFIGTSGATTVLGPGYERLRSYLGVGGGPARWLSRPLQYTWMDEEVLVRLGSDGRPVAPGPAGSALRRDVSDDWLIDDWGVGWQRRPGSLYFECPDPPLRRATLDDLERYPWPDLTAPSRFVGLAERAKAIQEAGYASVLLTGVTLFEQAYLMRGIDTQWVLPRGGPDDVRKEVRRRIRDLAAGGGYVAAAVHCLQPDVPPENIVAMCEEVAEAGRYPLRARWEEG